MAHQGKAARAVARVAGAGALACLLVAPRRDADVNGRWRQVSLLPILPAFR